MLYRDYKGDIVDAWERCTKCPFGEWARKVHLRGRGSPGDEWRATSPEFFLLGEAPGKSEDLLGTPFIGPAGRVLQLALDNFPDVVTDIGNALACRPTEYVGGPNLTPKKEHLDNCSPRLMKLVYLSNPRKGVVALGKSALNAALAYLTDYPIFENWHPSYILRSGGEKSKLFPIYVARFGKIFSGETKCLNQ